MNFTLNGSSIQTDNAVEVARVEFLGTRYDDALKANICQSAEKLEVFEDIDSVLYDLEKDGGASFSKVTKGRIIDDIKRIRALLRDAEKL